jgi:non-heme chloroperoxidase
MTLHRDSRRMPEDNSNALLRLPSGDVTFIQRPDGARIHTISAGSGPTVLLTHGYLLELQLYNLLFQRLVDAGHRVIAFDQRGHGQSTLGTGGLGSAVITGDYRAVLEHFAVAEAVLVAHSMSGFFSLVFCMEHAEFARRSLRRLVLVGANAGAVAQGSMQNRLQIPLLKSGVLRKLWGFPPAGRGLVGQLFGPDPDPRFVETTRQILLRQRERETWPMLNAMLDENYYPRLHEVTIEARVLCGSADRTCPAWHSRRLGAELANGTNIWLADKGHMLPYEAPDAIFYAVVSPRKRG